MATFLNLSSRPVLVWLPLCKSFGAEVMQYVAACPCSFQTSGQHKVDTRSSLQGKAPPRAYISGLRTPHCANKSSLPVQHAKKPRRYHLTFNDCAPFGRDESIKFALIPSWPP
eukprot:2073594-Amphidinium_carterae.1